MSSSFDVKRQNVRTWCMWPQACAVPERTDCEATQEPLVCLYPHPEIIAVRGPVLLFLPSKALKGRDFHRLVPSSLCP
jgi:hypothetical protein